jgi:LAO/AO transport system kinase
MPQDKQSLNSARDKARLEATARIQQAHQWKPEDLAREVMAGNREALAQAITWVESSNPSHQNRIEALLSALPQQTNSLRLGITGIPGAGKSTFIERFGMDAIAQGHRVAVLAVDPTSQRTGGSLLGDKTRMQTLSMQPEAFVRPSAAASTLGGVARATAEAIHLCEAAGYDLIVVETVGVGQSEVAVRAMVDAFVLLLIGGAGDDVQGIKRGVVEMADMVVVHKADGNRVADCRATLGAYQQALHLLPTPPSGQDPEVFMASSLTGEGHDQIWSTLKRTVEAWKTSGWWQSQREVQRLEAMERHAKELLIEAHMSQAEGLWKGLQSQVRENSVSAYSAARTWIRGASNPTSHES